MDKLVIKKCANCGAEFQAKNSNAKYCPECKAAVNRKKTREKNEERQREKFLEAQKKRLKFQLYLRRLERLGAD